MSSFQYDALKLSDRSKISGVINAGTEREARELLREQDLIPTKLKAITTGVSVSKKKTNLIQDLMSRMMGVGAKEKIAFTRNIGMMIRAGIPLTEALMYFEGYAENAKFKAVVAKVRNDILGGFSFSQALGKHNKIFNDVYVNVTKAGEQSGELEQTMSRLTDLLVKAEKLKMKIISAATYPAIVVVIIIGVLAVMFYFVIPTFVDIYDQLGVPLPFATKVMFALSDMVKNQWYITFPIIGIVGYGLFSFMTSKIGKRFVEKFILKVPVLGELTRFVQTSHFVSTFYVGFSSGLPITEALHLSSMTVTHSAIRKSLQKVNYQIQSGQRLAPSLAATGFIPEIVLLMISTGEESGDLERMLETSYEYLEDEIGHRVDILTALMEPVLLVIVGAIVCFVALSIYLPLFSMYEFI